MDSETLSRAQFTLTTLAGGAITPRLASTGTPCPRWRRTVLRSWKGLLHSVILGASVCSLGANQGWAVAIQRPLYGQERARCGGVRAPGAS
jgi:hypothetical protein